ncbi:hypothetical protein BJY01DRAFT_61528 [Aspergillus pseudoustus]|uniref:Uncharacterized protein n=1 Tax=Aspergillus pseudoustus TaxID=1810923 RepID=A0ABR4J7Q9_9EURO
MPNTGQRVSGTFHPTKPPPPSSRVNMELMICTSIRKVLQLGKRVSSTGWSMEGGADSLGLRVRLFYGGISTARAAHRRMGLRHPQFNARRYHGDSASDAKSPFQDTEIGVQVDERQKFWSKFPMAQCWARGTSREAEKKIRPNPKQMTHIKQARTFLKIFFI